MSGKHKPLLPPEYKFSSAPKDVKEQLELYMVRNFTGIEEEDRGSSDYAFLQDWNDVLSEFGRVGTRQKEIYAFCGALSRRLGEIIDIDRDLQWNDLAQKLRQQRWWNHYKNLQAAHADIDFKALDKLLQSCRDGLYLVSKKVSHRDDDHDMLDEQTAVHFSGDEEKASDDDGTTTAEIYITEEEYNSTAIGDSGSQRVSGSTLDPISWWDTIGTHKVMDLKDRKKVYHYDKKGKFVGLIKPEASDSETQDTSRPSHTPAEMKGEDF